MNSSKAHTLRVINNLVCANICGTNEHASDHELIDAETQ